MDRRDNHGDKDVTELQLRNIGFVRTFLEEIGRDVRACREQHRMTIRALALLLDIDHVKLHHCEHGRMVLDEVETQRVADWMRED